MWRYAVSMCAVLATCVVGVDSSAQPADALSNAYLAAIRAYQHGDLTLGMQLSAWSKGDFAKVRPILERAQPRDIATATVLHTDVALALPSTDGRRDLQLVFAETTLKLLPKDSLLGPALKSQWYHLVPTIYLSEWNPEAARPLIERGLDMFPNDGRLHVLLGIAYEMVANAHRIACMGQECEAGPRRSDLTKWRGFAATEYRRALHASADMSDAQLRLGRVLALNGATNEARSILENVLSSAKDMREQYLAALFSAALAFDTGDVPAAINHYERAVQLCSSCQTARVGLAFSKEMAGARQDAVAVIEGLLKSEASRGADPWLEYQFGTLDLAALRALKAEALR